MENKLSKFVTVDKKEEVLSFDLHNLIFRTVFPAYSSDPLDENFTYWKFLMMNGILKNIKKFKPDRVVLAVDSRNYWRKDFYSLYKHKRKGARAKSKVPFEKFFPIMEAFLNDLEKAFENLIVLKIDRCEADDIIAVLTREVFTDCNITNISTDHDFYQLMQNKNYQQFDPIKKQIVKHINPKKELLVKILTGDKSDNIPSVKSQCGPVTARKMIEEGLDIHLKNKDIKSNYERNKHLIDFDSIPVDIRDVIKENFASCTINKYNGLKVFNFLTKHRLNYFIDNLQQFADSIKGLH